MNGELNHYEKTSTDEGDTWTSKGFTSPKDASDCIWMCSVRRSKRSKVAGRGSPTIKLSLARIPAQTVIFWRLNKDTWRGFAFLHRHQKVTQQNFNPIARQGQWYWMILQNLHIFAATRLHVHFQGFMFYLCTYIPRCFIVPSLHNS